MSYAFGQGIPMWHVASKLGDFKTAELLFFIVQEARELMIKGGILDK